MYLDTDIILALVKKEDWLKEHVNFSKLRPATTSVFTVIEARIVLEREYSREEALSVLPTIRKLNIQLLPLDERVLGKSEELMQCFPRLNIFDSVHVAFALIYDDILVSTDTVFPTITNLKCKDPREIE
ncbi:PIN domain-containing protein [Candidatus Woesearchaeota archaeon]|nr:PIN domain-containing protein [Candidatus Woesearchaeota archaeon]